MPSALLGDHLPPQGRAVYQGREAGRQEQRGENSVKSRNGVGIMAALSESHLRVPLAKFLKDHKVKRVKLHLVMLKGKQTNVSYVEDQAFSTVLRVTPVGVNFPR